MGISRNSKALLKFVREWEIAIVFSDERHLAGELKKHGLVKWYPEARTITLPHVTQKQAEDHFPDRFGIPDPFDRQEEESEYY